MKIIKKALKIIAFLLILLILVTKIGKILEPKWYDEWMNTEVVDEFYLLPNNSIDVLAVGSSQVIKGFSSLELYNNYGISAYGLGTEQQSFASTYAWIKESLKTQNEKFICFEVKMFFEDTPEAQDRKGIDNMKFSLNKLEWIVNDSIEKKSYENFISYVFPITRFHSRWKELESVDYTKQHTTTSYRGYSIDSELSGNDDYEILNQNIKEERQIINDNSLNYFYKIVDYCKERNIELILIKNPDKDWDEERYNTISRLAKERNLAYLDFNTKKLSTEIEFDYSKDCEMTNHLNIYGAEKVTNYIGKYISENYDIIDKRENIEYAYLKEEAEKYNSEVENRKLKNIFDVGQYLELLGKGDFTLIISQNKKFSNQINEDFDKTLKSLGIDTEKIKKDNYCSIIQNGKKIVEESSDSSLEIEETIFNDMNFIIRAGDKASIILNGNEFSNNHSGINILVYNNRNKQIVECIFVDIIDGNVVMGR